MAIFGRMTTGLHGRRLEFLRALVRAADGRTDAPLDPQEVARKACIDGTEADALENWLSDRGFIKGVTSFYIAVTPLAVASLDELDQANEATTGGKEMALDPKKVFIVYGRNGKAFAAMRDFVRALGLEASDFNRMVEAHGGSPYVGQVINESMREMQAMVALFTPDEHAELREAYHSEHDRAEDRARWQARPNVIFEAGMAIGIDEKRTILVTLGKVNLASDFEGRHLVRISNAKEARDVLKKRLSAVGCDVNEQSDWLSAGDFDGAVQGLTYEPPGATNPLAPAAPVAPTSMSDDVARMKLVKWLNDNDHSDAAHGTPIEVTKIDNEAGVPAGATERLIRDVVAKESFWEVKELAGGHVRFSYQARITNVRTRSERGW